MVVYGVDREMSCGFFRNYSSTNCKKQTKQANQLRLVDFIQVPMFSCFTICRTKVLFNSARGKNQSLSYLGLTQSITNEQFYNCQFCRAQFGQHKNTRQVPLFMQA